MPRARKAAIAAAALIVVLFVVLMWGGFYLSGLIRDDGLLPNHEQPTLDLEVVAIGDGRITLKPLPESDGGDWMHEGIFGLVAEAGYDQVGEIIEISEQQVIRSFTPLLGDPEVGDMVRMDSYTFPQDPMAAHGIPFEVVSFSSSLGEFPAWYVEGSSDTWAILAHGRNAHRNEGLRILPTLVDMGFPALVINYRNDEGLSPDPSGLLQFGLTEWEELEGAAKYALEHGASRIVLVGYSMGGGIVTSFLYQSSLADSVSRVILDSPMLNFSATTDFQGSDQGYPQFIISYAKAFAALRFGVDWEGMNYLKNAHRLEVPVLLFHGDADKTVPIFTSEALAEARPDIVRFIRSAETDHVRSWNKDRDAYESAVREFLREVLSQGRPNLRSAVTAAP